MNNNPTFIEKDRWLTYTRGHQLYTDNGKDWFYVDTNELYKSETERDCVKCKMKAKASEPDPCLGYLPGVKYACCGHGVEEGYIMFENDVIIRFNLIKVES